MKLSEETLSVLKNFSSINSNIVIEEGCVLRTSNAPQNTVFSRAIVPDTFPSEVRIYDLNEFLSVINLLGGVESCDIEFEEQRAILKSEQNRSRVTYWYASKNVLLFPEKDIKMPEAAASFPLKIDVLSQLRKAAATFNHPSLSLYSLGGKEVFGKVYDPQVSSSNTYEIDVATVEQDVPKFDFIFSVNNLKNVSFFGTGMSSDSVITVNLASKGKAKISEFASEKSSYFVGVESDSTISEGQ